MKSSATSSPTKAKTVRATPAKRVRGRRQSVTALDSASAAPAGSRSRSVRFGYFQPEAREVSIVGTFNGWNAQMNPMSRDSFGDWSTEIDLPPGEHRYRFIVDGEWRDDPSAPQTVPNGFGGFDAMIVVETADLPARAAR